MFLRSLKVLLFLTFKKFHIFAEYFKVCWFFFFEKKNLFLEI